ncbi:16S rRNA (cytidine(1402)-2'-O)-methyltransferase [Thermaurantiacus sp.]
MSEPGVRALNPGLYIVATPIGNLGDLSPRAAGILRTADLIVCEDTRVTAKLLRHVGSTRPMLACHDHSPPEVGDEVLARAASAAVALVSDAGTPLVSDPGYRLVAEARRRGVPVTTAPGPCAAIAALSIAGLPADRFFFAGFLPTRARARDHAIAALAPVPGTLVFHETGPRLAATLAALARILGPREAAIARELTKLHEEVASGTLEELAARHAARPPPKGEIVVLVAPPRDGPRASRETIEAALTHALQTMPPGKAAASVAAAFGLPRGELYARALDLARRR